VRECSPRRTRRARRVKSKEAKTEDLITKTRKDENTKEIKVNPR
jgi:hypothetical protein